MKIFSPEEFCRFKEQLEDAVYHPDKYDSYFYIEEQRMKAALEKHFKFKIKEKATKGKK